MALSTIDRSKASHILYLRTPTDLIDRIDAFARSENLKTRQKAVFRLLELGLRQVESGEFSSVEST